MIKKAQLFNPKMKMADMLSYDPELLTILERLNIKLGFGDSIIADVCAKYGLSVDLFLIICNIYSFGDYRPKIDLLDKSDIPHIVSYLRASHNYYTSKFFPSLHETIHVMVEGCSHLNRRVLNNFYDNYDREITRHFEYEEKVVFPYIESFFAPDGVKNTGYSINRFSDNHSNIEEKLNDLKNIVIKYIPEESSNHERFEVVYNIYRIERDLLKHTMVENKLLIPLVVKLEFNGYETAPE